LFTIPTGSEASVITSCTSAVDFINSEKCRTFPGKSRENPDLWKSLHKQYKRLVLSASAPVILSDISILSECRNDAHTAAQKINKRICDLYEVKLADSVLENHARHLRDETVLEKFSSYFGDINSRTVLYRGPDMIAEDGIRWHNVENFLKNMAQQFPVAIENIDIDIDSGIPRP